MADAQKKAEATWTGSLAEGSGKVRLGSGLAWELPVTWDARTGRGDGKTSPEELIAAAHAACFSMALSHALSQGGNTPRQLDVQATCTFGQVTGGFAITGVHLSVTGDVPGMNADAFQQAAQGAKEGCPVSKALKGNVEITLDAKLKGA